MATRFVSAGWPYLYDIPGLHNCIPMLFADVVARYSRLRGEDVLYVTGSDEHGARIEFVAGGCSRTPKALIDEKYGATLPLLRGLGLSFDVFGRTSDPYHHEFCRQAFRDLLRVPGAITSREEPLPYCPRCRQMLPDRFVEGTCPWCGGSAFGNQCNNKEACGRMLEASGLRDARCALCRHPVERRASRHWYLDVRRYGPKVLPHLTSSDAFQADVRRTVEKTLAGVAEVSITRDSGWGIPVPLPEATGKTIYNWVDSLLGKVSTVARLGDGHVSSVWKDPSASKVFCMGPDSVSFYGVLFPALLEALGRDYRLENWCILPNEVFIYEGGVCSKSTGTGIWLGEALATLPADYWRFFIFDSYARRHDAANRAIDFRWDTFAASANEDLAGTIGQTAHELVNIARARPGRHSRSRGAAASASALLNMTEAGCECISSFLDRLCIGRAFLGLRDIFAAASEFSGAHAALPDASDVAAATRFLHRVTPLLSCYLPDTAERIWKRCAFPGTAAGSTWSHVGRTPPPALSVGPATDVHAQLFAEGPLLPQQIQREYNRRVEERRAQRTLREELTDARADAICVCPVDLKEQ